MFPNTRLALHVSLSGALVLGLCTLGGCGLGTPSISGSVDSGGSGTPISGILHGGPNPIVGAKITLYTTSSVGYGATAAVVATTTTDANGSFLLATTGALCPVNEFAYITAYGGSTGSSGNSTSLLMVPIGLCSSNYTYSSGNIISAYTGPFLWIDEVTTAVSAYALGNFMTVTNAGVVNLGAPANNHSTASPSTSTPSAAGLAHAFANALSIVNISTGLPRAYTNGGSSITTGGVVPVAELLLLGNILQACVNSNGPTGTNTATSNDGTPCGKLYSLTTPPQGMTTPLPVPTNTMQAMLDLARYPNPSVNTWNSGCTAAGSGTQAATTCLFNLAPSTGASYEVALTAAPPDWALAIVYSPGYGATVGPGNLGLSAPFYAALDYQDNVYVLNYDDYNSSTPVGAKTWSNVVGIDNNGAPIFSTAKDTTDLFIRMIATDTAGHVLGPQDDTTTDTNNYIYVYNTTTGALTTTITGGQTDPQAIAIDPFNTVYTASSSTTGINLRRITYTAPSTYTVYTQTTTAPTQSILSIAFDSNLDLYELGYGGTTPNVYMLPNMGTVAAPSLATAPTILTLPSGSSTINAWGIGPTSSGNAFVIDNNGVVPITKGTNSATTSGSTVTSTTTVTAGTPNALPAVYNSTLYNHYLSIDGNNWVYSGDGANNSAASGVSVYDSVDNLDLGTYKGCAISTGTTVCAGYVINKNNGVAIQDPRNTAIDSSGDIWVPSAGSQNYGSQNLTELIGAAAPTWPGLSMAKAGLPQ